MKGLEGAGDATDKLQSIKKLSDRIKERKQVLMSQQQENEGQSTQDKLMTTFEYFNLRNSDGKNMDEVFDKSSKSASIDNMAD